jgi:Icc-related predicted phosphoesterase
MLQFLYVTDLHGWTPGYEATLGLADRLGIHLIVNGGDMLPKGKSLERSLSEATEDQEIPRIFKIQAGFLGEYLPAHFEQCHRRGIRYLAMFGNDDLRCHWDQWRALLEDNENVDDLSTSWHHLSNDVIIRGCGYVPDVPFRLKDWSLRDHEDFVSPPQLARPVVSAANGLQVIDDLEQFLTNRPTLEQILDRIASSVESGGMERAIFVGHSPPAKTGLAVTGDGTDAGSSATVGWIEKNQPLLTLHGHIHESPDVSGIHTLRIGRTVCHNPGQCAPERVAVSVVTINQETVELQRMLLDPVAR